MKAKPLTAKLVISGSFECKDKDGNVLKVIHLNGSLPLNDEQTLEILENENGMDDRKRIPQSGA